MLIAIIIVAAIVVVTRTDYRDYFAATQFINFLLGPATVALAIPLARSARLVKENLAGVGLALFAGSVTSTISGLGLVWLFGGSRTVALSMAPKAATTPVAAAVSSQIGGVPALTAALAIVGGIVAAVVGRTMLTRLNVNDWRAHGLAAGVAGSGIAAAQVAARSEPGAAFAALGIGLNGVLVGIWCRSLRSSGGDEIDRSRHPERCRQCDTSRNCPDWDDERHVLPPEGSNWRRLRCVLS